MLHRAALAGFALAVSACQQPALCAARPDALWHDTPNACGLFDWNGDSRVEQRWDAQLPAQACTMVSGAFSYDEYERYFMSEARVPPDCGMDGYLVTGCDGAGGLVVSEVAQECR